MTYYLIASVVLWALLSLPSFYMATGRDQQLFVRLIAIATLVMFLWSCYLLAAMLTSSIRQ